VRAGDQPDAPVSEVDQVPGGQVAVESVLADRRQAVPAGAQRPHVRHAAGGEFPEKVITEAGGGQEESVDAALQQCLDRGPVRLWLVVGGCHDREVARPLAGVRQCMTV
jgi:hypothetical protein